MIVPWDVVGLIALVYIILGFFMIRAYWHDSKLPKEAEKFWEGQ